MHRIVLDSIAVRCFALHCVALLCGALICIALPRIVLYCIDLHVALNCVRFALHYAYVPCGGVLHCIALHCIGWCYFAMTLHSIAIDLQGNAMQRKETWL